MNAPCYVLFGPPGAGKGTQAVKLCERLNAVHLSTGEMLRSAVQSASNLGRQVASILDAGHLVPDDVMVPLVEERVAAVEAEQGILFDGFPRTLEQARALEAILERQNRSLEAALFLDVPHEELKARVLVRGRRDDTEAVIEERLAVYERETAPLRDYYEQRGLLHSVNGSGTVDEVMEQLLETVERVAK
jgi:adenylate kinase